MTDLQHFDEALDVVEVLRPLHSALDKLRHVGRLHGLAGGYRWTDDQLGNLTDVLTRLGEAAEQLERNRSHPYDKL